MTDWRVFQRDVLDVLRQYQGYFDFFEKVGSLDDSRPDCVARVTRDEKKEIFVFDAKKKDGVSIEDRERMEKYVSMIESNPVDVGLDYTELEEHRVRPVFITERETDQDEYETVSFRSLHQLLQKELIYTDIDTVIRDISKMLERKQLSQAEARLLFRSVKPFQERLERGMEKLREVETEFVGLTVEEPPIERKRFNFPIDAVAEHDRRNKLFLFDIPYSEKALNDIERKVEKMKNSLQEMERPVYYGVIDTFGNAERDYLVTPENLCGKIMEEAGIVSPDMILDLLKPKVKVEKIYGDSFVEIRDKQGMGFRARVQSLNDVKHRVEAHLPGEAIKKIRNGRLNTRDLGEISGNSFRMEIEITPGLEVVHGDGKEPWKSFRNALKTLYSSNVNPVLSRKVEGKV